MRPAMQPSAPTGAQDVARRLVDLLARAPPDAPRLARLDPAAPPARVVAVDGSSVTLAESGDHLLAAWRAGAVGLGAPTRVGNVEVALLAPMECRDLVRERVAAEGFPDAAPPRLDPKGALDALRTISELRHALAAVDTLDADDLLLVDGALQSRAHLPLTDRLVEKAKARGVHVVGVCKSTSILLGHAPALVACALAGRASPHATWSAPLPTPPLVRGRSYAARLSPAEPRAFRYDVAAADGDDHALLARIAGLCGHPAYPGYPSPLAMAHNAVLLNEDAKRRLRTQLQEAALAAGVPERAWDAAFLDYHDVLELGA